MPNTFLHLQKSLASRPQSSDDIHTITVVYLVPGNPGLIEYYFPFLDLLAKDSENWVSDTDEPAHENGFRNDIVIAGASLGGFDAPATGHSQVSRGGTTPGKQHNYRDATGLTEEQTRWDDPGKTLFPLYPSSFSKQAVTGTYTLRDQISLTYARINALVEILQQRYPATKHVNVILAGHSVGAYIAVEVIRLHHASTHLLPAYTGSETEHANTSSSSASRSGYTIPSTLHLTPTITDISHSPSGRFATPLLTYLPFLPTVLQLGASGLAQCLPTTWFKAVVRRVTGMKSEDMVGVTVSFLQREGCVTQALELARHEMREIGEGSWGDVGVWGDLSAGSADTGGAIVRGEGEGQIGADVAVDDEEHEDMVLVGKSQASEDPTWTWKAPKHYFLFAKGDHWVADDAREVILGHVNGRAKILVDKEKEEGGMGIVHAWCLEQSGIVAEIVGGWMREILGEAK